MTHPEMCRKLEILGFRFQRQAVDSTRSGLIRQTGGGPPSPGTGTGDRGHRHPSPNSQKPGNLQRPTDLRLSQDPPITSLRLEMTGNKSKKGREVPMLSGTPTSGTPSSTGFPRRVFQQRTTWPGRSAQNSHGLDSERLPRTRRVRGPEAKVSLNRSVRKQPRTRGGKPR